LVSTTLKLQQWQSHIATKKRRQRRLKDAIPNFKKDYKNLRTKNIIENAASELLFNQLHRGRRRQGKMRGAFMFALIFWFFCIKAKEH
jgi:hypothetical protein